jgi:hypothetical protein
VRESDDGFCYIDVDQGVGNEDLVLACPDGARRRLRMVGANENTPVSGAVTFMVCD